MQSFREQWNRYSALEKNAAVLSLTASAGVLLSAVLTLAGVLRHNALIGLLGAIALLCYGILQWKKHRILGVLLWIAALFALYTAAETFCWEQFGIYIGEWHQFS